jgi:RNA polymerase sigma-70 factor (ECF subfamily)
MIMMTSQPAEAMSDDLIWVQRTLAGDVTAFSHLVNRYKGPVYSLAYRMLGQPADAEDAAQEAFVRAFTKLNTFDPQRKFSTWLLSITANLCVDHLRRKRPAPLDDLAPDAFRDRTTPEPESLLIRYEQQTEVQNVLESLPAKYRDVVVLHYWRNLSCAEIGQRVGLSENGVKTRLHRARQMLAQRLQRPEPGWALAA